MYGGPVALVFLVSSVADWYLHARYSLLGTPDGTAFARLCRRSPTCTCTCPRQDAHAPFPSETKNATQSHPPKCTYIIHPI
ncbi:hypothetical protein GGI42DRAFT_320361 [Trichoderma sp. SZMC 28013]